MTKFRQKFILTQDKHNPYLQGLCIYSLNQDFHISKLTSFFKTIGNDEVSGQTFSQENLETYFILAEEEKGIYGIARLSKRSIKYLPSSFRRSCAFKGKSFYYELSLIQANLPSRYPVRTELEFFTLLPQYCHRFFSELLKTLQDFLGPQGQRAVIVVGTSEGLESLSTVGNWSLKPQKETKGLKISLLELAQGIPREVLKEKPENQGRVIH